MRRAELVRIKSGAVHDSNRDDENDVKRTIEKTIGAGFGLAFVVLLALSARQHIILVGSLFTVGVLVAATLIVYYDKLQRKRAEALLRRASAFNRSLIEASLDPLVTMALDGKITDVNQATEKVTGFPRQELIGTDFSSYFTQPEKARVGYQQVFRDGFVQDYELEIRHREGHLTPVIYNAALDRDGGGGVIGVFAAARDISERKRVEQALRESEERLRSFIDNVPLGVYRTTPDGRVLMANPALLRMLGYNSIRELAFRNLERQGFEPDYSRSAFREQIARQGEVRGLEATWKRRDGSVVFIRESARAVRAEDGRVLYYDGTVEDVTERRRLEEQFRQAQKMEAMGRLAGGVAHDFINLLTVVIGYSDFLLQRLSTGNRMRRPLEEIKGAGERAAGLTRQLLAFGHKPVHQPQVLDLNSLRTNVECKLGEVLDGAGEHN